MRRLAIRRRRVPVLVSVGPVPHGGDLNRGHRHYDMRRHYVVLVVTYQPNPANVRRPLVLNEQVVYLGQDDGIIGWANCVDFVTATLKQAQR